MFARLFTFHVREAAALEAKMTGFSQENMPAVQAQKGFIKMYHFLDGPPAEAGQFQLWATEADLLTYLEGPLAAEIQSRAQAIVKDHAIDPPQAVNYEVTAEF
jgi:hypothetical protein